MRRSLSGRGGRRQSDTHSRNTAQMNCRETDRRRGRQDEVSDTERGKEERDGGMFGGGRKMGRWRGKEQ